MKVNSLRVVIPARPNASHRCPVGVGMNRLTERIITFAVSSIDAAISDAASISN